jgi:hypothetical protein
MCVEQDQPWGVGCRWLGHLHMPVDVLIAAHAERGQKPSTCVLYSTQGCVWIEAFVLQPCHHLQRNTRSGADELPDATKTVASLANTSLWWSTCVGTSRRTPRVMYSRCGRWRVSSAMTFSVLTRILWNPTTC